MKSCLGDARWSVSHEFIVKAIDHLIPQASFKKSLKTEVQALKHSVGNLVVLPEKVNTAKKDRALSSVANKMHRDQIKRFAAISDESEPLYDKVENAAELCQNRRNRLRAVWGAQRQDMLEHMHRS